MSKAQVVTLLGIVIVAGVLGIGVRNQLMTFYKSFKAGIVAEAIASGEVVRTSQISLKGWPKNGK